MTTDGDRFVAIGLPDDRDQHSVLTSADGLVWRVRARNAFDGQGAASIQHVDGRYLAVAFRQVGPEWNEPYLWSSPDAQRWSVLAKWPALGWPRSIARLDNQWLEVDDFKHRVLASTDGRHWTTAVDFGLGEGTQLVRGPAGLLVGASRETGNDTEGKVITSEAWSHITTDGNVWSRATIATLGGVTLDRVGANDSGYVALGRGRWTTAPFVGAAWWSHDGLEWNTGTLPPPIDAEDWFVDQLEAYGGGFLATAQPPIEGPPRLLWSATGRSWMLLDGGPDAPVGTISLIVDGPRVLVFGQEDARTPDVAVVWEGLPDA